MKKMGVTKRILWCWETICYSLLVAYLVRLLFEGVNDAFIGLLCSPTAIFMVLFAKDIYSDKIKWEKIKLYEWILPIVGFTLGAIYGLLKEFYVFPLALGMLITIALFMLVAFKGKQRDTN